MTQNEQQTEQRNLGIRLADAQMLPSSTSELVHSVNEAQVDNFIVRVRAKMKPGQPAEIAYPWNDPKSPIHFRALQRSDSRLEPIQDAVERELRVLIEAKLNKFAAMLES